MNLVIVPSNRCRTNDPVKKKVRTLLMICQVFFFFFLAFVAINHETPQGQYQSNSTHLYLIFIYHQMPAHPVILILGSGPRVGAAVAKQFASTGYSVAITSRSASAGKTTEGYLSVKADLSNPSSISAVFDAVKAEFQSPPSVVVYNAAALTPPADDTLFSIPADSVAADLNVNTVSAYAAAQEAVKGWEGLPQNTNKLFIFTGNMQNKAVIPMPLMLNLGIGKSASAYWIGAADRLYSGHGYR